MPPAYPPLGILYIAAILESIKCDVRLLDLDAERIDNTKLSEILRAYNPDLVGITAVTSTFPQAILAAKIAKEICKAPIILGGIHATIAPQESLASEYIDFVVHGEGEETIKEFVEVFSSSNDSKNYATIKGLAYKENGQFKINPPRELIIELDNLAFPARNLIKAQENYRPPDAVRIPVTTLMTSRGCPGNCTFCCTKHIFGRRVRLRSIENVMMEIEEAINQLGIKEFHIMDDCFTVNKRRVLDFCSEVKKRKFDVEFVFSNGLRADQVNEEILRALKEIKVRYVGFGVESGNEEILKNIKKGIKKDTIKKAFELSKQVELETWGYFMIGLPGETYETVRETIKFAKELDPDFAKFLILKPYPRTAVYEDFLKQNLLFDFNYDHYGAYTGPVHKLPGMDAMQMVKLQKKANFQFYFRPRKLLRLFLRLKSFKQACLSFKAGLFIFKGILLRR